MTTATHGSLERAIVGAAVGPITHALDARWLMAYAAALAETDPRYYDTRAAGGPLAHPLFPVCYEWPAAVALRDATVPAARRRFAAHHRPRARGRATARGDARRLALRDRRRPWRPGLHDRLRLRVQRRGIG